MSSHLILAPAAHGKTYYTIQRIQETLASEPLAPITVILPNQIRVNEVRRRLAVSGGALGVNLVTFHTLYAQILTHAGQPRARLFVPVQVRLLRGIVDRLCSGGQMVYYAPLRAKPGFIAALRTIIEEIKRARIEPEDITAAAAGMDAKITEIATVYSKYQEWLLQQDWADPEGHGWLAALALDSDSQLESGLRLLVVNGFDEFNPTQLGVLTLLAQRADETLITLTGDLENPYRTAHRRFHRALDALTASLALSPTSLPADFKIYHLPAPLTHLEANLFKPTIERSDPLANLQFLEAQTQAAEARAALRWIKTCLVRDGFEISDVAILARNLTPYRPFLEEVAAEFGLPLRIIGGLPLSENPAIAALLSLLSAPALDWPRLQVLTAWRSPYFDWSAEGIALKDAAGLDSITRQGRVIKGLDQWRDAFDLLAQKKDSDKHIVDEDDIGAQPTFDIDRLATRFEAFVSRIAPPKKGTVRDYVSFIEDLIGDNPNQANRYAFHEDDASLQVVVRALENATTAERDAAALGAFKDVLRGLVLSESVLGTDILDYADFYTELRSAVVEANFSASSKSGILAASVLAARGLSFRAVAILGLSEGEFPQRTKEDPFLSETDRTILQEQDLPIETKLHGDESTFFYQAVTRASERLLLSRPYLADDGQLWEPSPYWLQVWRMFGQPTPKRVRPEDPLNPNEAASPVEFSQANGELDPHLIRGISILQSRLSEGAASPYNGKLDELSSTLTAHYDSSFGWSASKLESFGTCPFYFYIAYALDLAPRTDPEEGYDARILGSMLHQILEFTYAQVSDPKDLEECLQRMPEIAREVFKTAPAEYGFRPTPLWEMQQSELTGILSQTITVLSEISQGYTPRHFEPRFGMGNPSLTLQTEIGKVRLHGYIDRIDESPDGSLRIIDYKAGSATISSRDLEDGRRLQLPIYALAARDALNLGEIAGGFYWHIGSSKASSLKLEKYPGGVQAAFKTAVQHVTQHVKNIREGRFTPIPPKNGCPNYCPSIGFCWQYRKSF